LKRFFLDHYGKPSSMRLALLVPIALVMGVWTYLSLKLGAMQDVPLGLGALILGLVAGNIGKAAFEKVTSIVETRKVTTPKGSATESKVSESAPAAAPETNE
jgi:hypothetical protein